MTSKAAARMYATIGKSVSGGWSGLPDHPRSPLYVRPLIVRVGRTESFLTWTPLTRRRRSAADCCEREELLSRPRVLAQQAADCRRHRVRAMGSDAAQRHA